MALASFVGDIVSRWCVRDIILWDTKLAPGSLHRPWGLSSGSGRLADGPRML